MASPKLLLSLSRCIFCRALIILLLMIAGNIHINPGPENFTSDVNLNGLSFGDFCSRKCLGCLHINARSLVPKMDELKVWVHSSNPEVLVITETWLRNSISYPEVHLPGYNLFRQDRSSKGGGVAIFVKEHLHCSTALARSIPKQFDLLVLNIKLSNNYSLSVAGCYRPPSAPACALAALSSALAPFTRSECVILGDLNWDMFNPPDRVTQQFDSLNLHQIISLPTRYNPKNHEKFSLLDVIYTNSPYMYQSGVFCSDISDHCFTACIRTNCSVKKPILTSSKRILKHFDEQAFLHDLASVKWFRISLIPSIQDAWNLFYEMFSAIVNKHAPVKKFRIRNRHSPWFDHKLTVLLQQKNAAWRQARQSKSPGDRLAFRQIRNKALQAVRKAKIGYFKDQFSLSGSDPKRFWKTVRELENKPATHLPLTLNVDNLIVSNKAQMVDIFNQHFIKSGFTFESANPPYPAGSSSPSSPPLHSPVAFHPSPPPNPSISLHSFTLQAVSEASVLDELLNLDPKKAAGSDELDPFFFKMAAPIIAAPIANLFNLSVQTAEIPTAWKAAIVRPLFKGGDQADPNCYRPISLLPCLSKILEKLVNKQLSKYLKDHNILSGVQSGFRTGYGCITATLKIINDVVSALGTKQYCAAIFIDLAKAFDTVDHSILLDRLGSIGVSGHSLAWFSNYLTNRAQQVKSEHHLSQSLSVTKGVPQGSILGPTLFSIYINNIACSVKDASIHLYADDTVLYAVGPTPDAVLTSLQDSFRNLQQALSTLHLLLNSNKTKVMWFSRKGSAPFLPQEIKTLDGTVLDQVTEYKYLGIWLDNTLSFSHHINKLQSKIKCKLGFLYRMRSTFTSAARLTLVQMVILPMLDYGDVIYRSACKGSLQKLDVLYHSAIRFATNAPFKTHHCTLYSSVNWPSLHTRRNTHWLMLIYKTLLGLSPPYLCQLLQITSSAYTTRSARLLLLKVPKTNSVLGNSSFSAAAARDWNELQKKLKLDTLISKSAFKHSLMDILTDICSCFAVT